MALRQDLLPSDARRSWSSPQRHQLIAGDGTVAKSPTLSSAARYKEDPTYSEATDLSDGDGDKGTSRS